jgi:hypothetical protein
MIRTLTLSLDVEDGEDILLVAMCSTGLTLSVARPTPKEFFGKIVGKLGGSGTRPVTAKLGEPREPLQLPPDPTGGVFDDLSDA